MQFSPLWRTCEARIGLFMRRERSRKQFSPRWISCEARIGLLMAGNDQESSSHICGVPVKLD